MAVVAPSTEDDFARGLARWIGGPFGRHGAPRLARRGVFAVVLAVTYVVVVLAWLQKSPCISHPWSNNFQYTHYCYTDVSALYYDERLSTLKIPYLDNETPGSNPPKYMEYPVLTGWYMLGAAEIAHHIEGPTTAESTAIAQGGAAAANATAAVQARQAKVYFDVSAIGMGLAAVGAAVLVAMCAGRRRPWDAMMFAVAPVLLFYLDVNWDILATLAAVATLAAWGRRRWWLAGVLLGLGVSAKFYPLLLLPAIALVAYRARQFRPFAKLCGTGVATWLIVNVPVWVANPAGFERFYSFNSHRPADFDSWTFAWQDYVFGSGHQWNVSSLNVTTGLLFVICLAGIAVLALRAIEPPRLAQLAFLIVVAFLLTNKVYSPQYAVFLLPFVVLARPRWGYFLAWQATEIALFLTRYLYFVNLGDSTQGLTYTQYFLIGIVPRDLVLIGLASRVVQEIRRPSEDVVRTDEELDPLVTAQPWTAQPTLAT
ncbi:MAG TPA: glycosyltransferase 87 family protein [Mycobacteriales bacterium]|nr:glycosyltransferase 87 family protein [Mycobacteriales bacterium]